MATLIKVSGEIQNNVFGTVLLSMGLLFRWIGTRSVLRIGFKKVSSAALRAMTVPEIEGAAMLFVIFLQLLKLCGAIHKFRRSFF